MTPARILRAKARAFDPSYFILTPRQELREARILAFAQNLLAEEGRHNISFTSLAKALHMSRATLSFHYVDLESLLGTLIRRHLQALAAHLGNIDADDPEIRQKRRAAYLSYTRTPRGGFTEAHRIYVRDRHTLPEDELESIELTRHGLGLALAGDLAEEALLLLDAPNLDAPRIEARLAIPELPPRPKPQTAPATTTVVAPAPPPTPSPPDRPITRFADFPDPPEKPGDWIYTCGQPLARPPPIPAQRIEP